ncbi:MAG: hypothetical protein WCB96_12670 [Candidatus Aminicenantales bacterium]
MVEKIYHTENWSRKGSAILLLVSGIIFYLVWGKEIFSNLLAGTIPRNIIETGLPTNGVYVIDTAFCLPALIIGGYRLLKKRKLGVCAGRRTLGVLNAHGGQYYDAYRLFFGKRFRRRNACHGRLWAVQLNQSDFRNKLYCAYPKRMNYGPIPGEPGDSLGKSRSGNIL